MGNDRHDRPARGVLTTTWGAGTAMALVLVLGAACGAPPGWSDGGIPDGAVAVDGGQVRDGGVLGDGGHPADGGTVEDGGGTFDGGTLDGGASDGGTFDGGGLDGGVLDGGGSDGGAGAFEACCASSGCNTSEEMEACAAFEPAYGRCSVAGVAGVCVDTGACGGDWSPAPGFCPGPANIQCCRPPTQACTGQEHPLPNQGLAEMTYDGRCPPGMKVVDDAFCVDVYEAFLVEELPDGGVVDWSPYFNPGLRTMRALSVAGAVPQGYINGDQAEAACQRAGKRLCSNTEWLRACRGASSLIYPYGNTREDGVCNDARSVHPAVEYFGSSDPSVFSKIDHPCLNQLANGLARTGANVGCVTAEGLFDMMGNLHEWTNDPTGTFRGGFYVDTRINGEGCLYRTIAHNRLHWDYSTGFRCCAALR